MKKLLLLALLMETLTLWSQTSQRLTVNNMAEKFQVFTQSSDNQFQPGHLNDINTNALRHFIKTFNDAEILFGGSAILEQRPVLPGMIKT